MSGLSAATTLAYLPTFTARTVPAVPCGLPQDVPDSLAAGAPRERALAVVGTRSPAVTHTFALHKDPAGTSSEPATRAGATAGNSSDTAPS
jgi:hypothetical protein